MINVSNDYKTKIYDDSTQTVCTVSYGAYDLTAKRLATVTSNGKQSFSNEEQTLNTINNFKAYSDLELNNWTLDGSVNLFPNNPSGTEWGWWSLAMSDEEGEFTTNPLLTYTWSENHSSIALTLQVNEPILGMTIKWYNGSNTLIDTYNYTNTDLTETTIVIDNGVENYRKIEIEFTKVLPYHYVKVQDVMFGREFLWQNEIISVEVEESLDPKMQRLSSNQAIVRLNNINNEFNKYNPDNKLAFLQEGQRMAIYNNAMIEGQYEEVPLGVFYLTSWGSPTQFTVEFRANDLLYKMNDDYIHSKMYTNASISTIVGDLFAQYGDTVKYVVDSSLDGVTLSGYIPVVDTRTALQHIAFACGAVVKVDRYGEIVIKRLSSTAVVDTIGYNRKMFAMDKEAERYNSVTLSKYLYKAVARNIDIYDETITGTQDITIMLDEPAHDVTHSGSGTYTSMDVYANCIEIKDAHGALNITGKGYKINQQKVEKYVDDTAVGITKSNMPVDSIYLIGSNTADYVATWLLNMLQKYLTNEFRWLANPAIEIGDFVTLQVDENQYKTALVTKNKFTFNGALSETSEVVIW